MAIGGGEERKGIAQAHWRKVMLPTQASGEENGAGISCWERVLRVRESWKDEGLAVGRGGGRENMLGRGMLGER